MQVNGIEGFEQIVNNESGSKKLQILIYSLVMTGFGIIASGMYMSRYINAMNIDSAF